ncbi:MAG: anti-sigma factor [Alphaproteobacteria bacterium]|nr:MAG: anti-sigma factor [Alphaproteobacteria bacterium]
MTQDKDQISEADLHAYADGKLSGERKTRVEAFLAEHPGKAEEVADWKRQVEAIRMLHEHIAEEPLPPRLQPHAIAARMRAGTGGWRSLAASVLLLLCGGILGWFGHGYLAASGPSGEPLVSQAISAHAVYAVEVRHPVEVGADEEQHLVNWLSKRLQQPVRPADLRRQGFTLVGGRLLPAAHGPAAQFMYEDKSGQRLTLYITHHDQPRNAAFRFASQAGLNAFYWLDEKVSYALVGEVSRERLRSLAHEVYNQLADS